MNNKFTMVFFTSVACLLLPTLASAQHDAGMPQLEDIKSLYPGKAYSPYAERSFPSNIYWGETHLHTGLSLDSFAHGPVTRCRFVRQHDRA